MKSVRIYLAGLLAPTFLACLIWQVGSSQAAEQTAEIYQQNCAVCHGEDRFGGHGPALLPQNLGRLKPAAANEVITNGRIQTQMPGFADKLDSTAINALVDYIYQPPSKEPVWGEREISASRELPQASDKVSKPIYTADPLNLFVVVEIGDHHASIIDGDKFISLARFPTPYAVHGGPKFTPDGRFVFFMSRDGWVLKYDLWGLVPAGKVRAGINSRNIAISKDGKYLAVANYLPQSLVILDTSDLTVKKILKAADRDNNPSRVSAVYQAPTRDSFIAALKDVPEVWEISTHINPGKNFTSTPGDDASAKGLFALRRIAVPQVMDDFFFDPDYRQLIGSARKTSKAIVVDIEQAKVLKTIDLPGLPHLGSGISWDYKGHRVMATPHLRENMISVIDMNDWRIIKQVKTDGPGFFMRSHAKTPYAWADVFFGPHRDQLLLMDKKSLEIVKVLIPEPGKTVAHVEFDRDGSHALVSIWENDGAVIVYDAKTLQEVKRLPMSKPSGKYNVWNKITFSEGTSH